MKHEVLFVVVVVLCVGLSECGSGLFKQVRSRCHPELSTTLYDFHLKELDSGAELDWARYKGSAVLVSNVASFSHNTDYQYRNMYDIWDTILSFKVIAVPCNQFAREEPGANATEIRNAMKYVRPGRGFRPLFTMTEKLDVNGDNEHPLFTFLKRSCPPPVEEFQPVEDLHYEGFHSDDIRWNFEKFLLDKHGRPVYRYSSYYCPCKVAKDVHDVLKRP